MNAFDIDDPGLSDQDKSHVRSWNNLRAERIVNGKLSIGLSIERRWPKSFAYICRTDAEAYDIARQRGWINPDNSSKALDKRMQDDWGSITETGLTAKLIEVEKLHRVDRGGPKIAAACLSFLRTAIGRHAPHLVHLIPDRFADAEIETRRTSAEQLAAIGSIDAAREAVARATAAFEARRGRAPGALSEDALASARDGSQAVQAARAHQEAVRRRDTWTPPWEA
jgi:phage terminase Nu1 subunit (DNA packaging protein)